MSVATVKCGENTFPIVTVQTCHPLMEFVCTVPVF